MDWTKIAEAFIGNLPATLAAVGALIGVWRAAGSIEKVQVNTDGIKDALVATARDKALLEGHAAGANEERARGAVKAEGALLEQQRVAGKAPPAIPPG